MNQSMPKRVITIEGFHVAAAACIGLMAAACYGAFFGVVVLGAIGDPDSVSLDAEGVVRLVGLIFLVGSVGVFALSALALVTRRAGSLVAAAILAGGLLILYELVTG
jgi:hypothetical protein